jgi:hypothetical protein
MPFHPELGKALGFEFEFARMPQQLLLGAIEM